MQDGFDAPSAALSDFPSDPVVHHHVLAWLSVAALLVVATATLTLVYKSAERMARNRLGDGVDARVKAVRKTLEAAARARAGDQVERAQAARAALREHFGGVLELSAHLGKATDGLNKALEGMREEDAKPSSGGAVHGGTVINIAVANGAAAPMPGPAEPAPESHAESPPESQTDALWRAVQKLFAYWSHMNVVAAAFRAAQTQLLQSPVWTAPHETPPPEAPRFRRAAPDRQP